MKRMRTFFVLLIVVSFIAGTLPFAFAEQSGKININTAPLEELIKLKKYWSRICEKDHYLSRYQRSVRKP